MTVKAMDLPESVKKDLLDKIRGQIGETEYDRMVGIVGENGLLDIILNSAPSSSTLPSSCTAPESVAQEHSDLWSTPLQALTWFPPGNIVIICALLLGAAFEWIADILASITYPPQHRQQGGCTAFMSVVGVVGAVIADIIAVGPWGIVVIPAIYLGWVAILFVLHLIDKHGLAGYWKWGVLACCVGSVGVSSWFWGAWMIQGTVQWWQWLGGHF